MTSVAAPPAQNAADLIVAEEIVIWSIRTVIENCSAWPLVKDELRRACGLICGEAVALGLARLLELLGSHARRDLMVHQPHCACLGEDERSILNLIAAAQARNRELAEAIGGWLVPRKEVGRLVGEATFLCDALAAHGLLLAVRLQRTPQPDAPLTIVSPVTEQTSA